MWNPWKPLNALGQSFQQPGSWTSASLWTVFCLVCSPLFCMIYSIYWHKQRSPCLHPRFCERCSNWNTSVPGRIEVVMYSKYSAWLSHWVRPSTCRSHGAFSRIRRTWDARFFDFGNSLQTRLYWHGLLPHLITTNWWPFLSSSSHTHKAVFNLWGRGNDSWLTQENSVLDRALVSLLLLISC
jgi:hypothetical protein